MKRIPTINNKRHFGIYHIITFCLLATVDSETIMVSSSIRFILLLLSFNVVPSYGGISWGQFLGVGWAGAEELMRKNVAISIRNVIKYCSADVSKCPGGKEIVDKMKANGGDNDAVTIWTSSHFRRHEFYYYEDIPLGFGDADHCLRELYGRKEKIEQSKRLAPKCHDWISKTNDYFYAYLDREESDDKREWVVIFATLFAMTLSAAVGYMIGIYQKEHEDILAFSYERRRESKKIFVILALAVAVPACIVLFTCPKLLVLMTITFVLGRVALWYKLRKEDVAYSTLSGDSGLVFAAIPVQMD